MESVPGVSKRPVHINFELCCEPEDYVFKLQLVELMIESVTEFRDVACESVSSWQPEDYRKGLHKAKSTLSLLADTDFNSAVQEFRETMYRPDSFSGSKAVQDGLAKVVAICDATILGLQEEAETYRKRIQH